MIVKVFRDRQALGRAAAERGAAILKEAIARRGKARIVAAAAASQFEFLESLTSSTDIDWKKVELFHLDEYVDLPLSHPASFRRFLLDRLIQPTGIVRHHLLEGDGDLLEVLRAASQAVTAAPIDVSFVGIGENGHLAFNDPPADLVTEQPYLVVTLDQACRQQQVNEGWFQTLDAVPRRAISMSVRQVLRTGEILAMVPGRAKAQAVRAALTGSIGPKVPASALRQHPQATLYLDRESAALLGPELIDVTAP